MAVEVVVRISPDMFREDVDALRLWLDRAFPYDWVESTDSRGEDTLSISDILITAVLTAAADEVGHAVADEIRKRIAELVERYQNRHGDLAEVDVKQTADATAGAPADPASSPHTPPDGTDRETA